MQVLADDRIDSLHSLTTARESKWFGGRDGCVESLFALIARQPELKLRNMHGNGLAEEQKQQVRNAVASPDCRLVFTDGLLKQLRTAQVHFF